MVGERDRGRGGGGNQAGTTDPGCMASAGILNQLNGANPLSLSTQDLLSGAAAMQHREQCKRTDCPAKGIGPKAVAPEAAKPAEAKAATPEPEKPAEAAKAATGNPAEKESAPAPEQTSGSLWEEAKKGWNQAKRDFGFGGSNKK